LLFLAVPIFKRDILGSVLLAVPYIFVFSYFLGGLLFLAVLLLAGVGTMQHDMWQQLRVPYSMTCGIIISSSKP
jgi:hypothetical protein